MTRYFGRVCSKHPELYGERLISTNACLGCKRQWDIAGLKKKLLNPEYRKKHNERNKKNITLRRLNDPEYLEKVRAYARAKSREKYKLNPEHRARMTSYNSLRDRKMLQARPPWVTWKEVALYYEKAASLGLTVDHVIPINHPLVCGLHVPWNFQMLTRSDNSKKLNKFLSWEQQ